MDQISLECAKFFFSLETFYWENILLGIWIINQIRDSTLMLIFSFENHG